MERYDEFEQYIRETEPGPKERARLWQTAIGLQKVDGLEVKTRPTAVVTIKNSRSEPTHEFLVLFFRNLLLSETHDLKNRHLHIRWNEELSSQQNSVSSQESLQETIVSSQEKPELILKMLENNPNMNLQEIAHKLNMTRRGVQKITDKLKSDGRLEREGSTKSGKWVVKR